MGPSNKSTTEPFEVLAKYIATKGLRMTQQRKLIAEVLFESDAHLNIDELYAAVKSRDKRVGYATLYRTLKLLTECGLAVSSTFGDGPARFESTLNRDHHDHLICTKCGKIIEFENDEIEQLQLSVCKELGFKLVDHKMELYGECTRTNCPDAN